ncbi:MAG: four helix bundle protein [Anaerolineales bacterium]
MVSVSRFEDLECWKTARELVRLVYKYSEKGGLAKDYGFRNQICRAAVSIMSNIAEGFESQTQGKFTDYLGHAKASAGEVRSQLYAAVDLGYLSKEQFAKSLTLVQMCSKQIHGLISYLKSIPNSYRIREEGTEYQLDIDQP